MCGVRVVPVPRRVVLVRLPPLRLLHVELDRLQVGVAVIVGALARVERELAEHVLALARERAPAALGTDAVGGEELREEAGDARVVGIGLAHQLHAVAVAAVATLGPRRHLLRVEPVATHRVCA